MHGAHPGLQLAQVAVIENNVISSGLTLRATPLRGHDGGDVFRRGAIAQPGSFKLLGFGSVDQQDAIRQRILTCLT